jgi:hypothetical protein
MLTRDDIVKGAILVVLLIGIIFSVAAIDIWHTNNKQTSLLLGDNPACAMQGPYQILDSPVEMWVMFCVTNKDSQKKENTNGIRSSD